MGFTDLRQYLKSGVLQILQCWLLVSPSVLYLSSVVVVRRVVAQNRFCKSHTHLDPINKLLLSIYRSIDQTLIRGHRKYCYIDKWLPPEPTRIGTRWAGCVDNNDKHRLGLEWLWSTYDGTKTQRELIKCGFSIGGWFGWWAPWNCVPNEVANNAAAAGQLQNRDRGVVALRVISIPFLLLAWNLLSSKWSASII